MQLLQKQDHLALAELSEIVGKPELFAPGCEPFWNDPHISRQMLKAHLDQETDAASRNLEVVEATVENLAEYLGLPSKLEILDLGSGPGLYAERFAERGATVTGIDCSENSIRYARKRAKDLGLDISYKRGDFCDLDDHEAFDAALIIYGQLGALLDSDRSRLLAAVHRALKPGGHLIFDVITGHGRGALDGDRSWLVVPGEGFWRPQPHLVLDATFHYPEANVYLDQYAVIEEGGEVCVYRMWEHYYSPQSISELLGEHRFKVDTLWGDLCGKPCGKTDPWLAVAASKI